MRSRDIKPGFFKNDQLAECSFPARLLFPGLWMLADREGRLENRPRKIKAEIFPFDDVDVAALLRELESAGLISSYEVNGTRLLWIPQFKKHQSPHKNEKCSELPAHPGEFSEGAPYHEKTNFPQTPVLEETAPVISGKIPLTPSSLTPSSLPPEEEHPNGCSSAAPAAASLPLLESPKNPPPPPAEQSPPDSRKRPAEDSAFPPCPHQRLVALYHEVLPMLPRVRVWNDKRRKNAGSRWRETLTRLRAKGAPHDVEAGLAWWRQYFARVRASPFLLGQGHSAGNFRADLAWLVLPENYAKVLEGRYLERQQPTVLAA